MKKAKKMADPPSWGGPVISERWARAFLVAMGLVLACPLFWDAFFGETYITVTAPAATNIELRINHRSVTISAKEIRTFALPRRGTDTVRVKNLSTGFEQQYVLEDKPNNSRFLLPTDKEQCFAKIRVRELFEMDKGNQPFRPRVLERHSAAKPVMFYMNDPWPRPKVVQYVPDPWMIPRPYDPITQLDFLFAVPCAEMTDDGSILQAVSRVSA